MTIGIGGWGPRRKPMALVRAILRSDLTDLTDRQLGRCRRRAARPGRQDPQAGLRVRLARLDPARAELPAGPAERQPIPEIVELDEGMFQTGLHAAAQRLPFLPMRAGLGSDVLVNNPWIKTVTSPYADENGDRGAGRRPRPEARRGAGAPQPRRRRTATRTYLGPDPYFDDLFCRPPTRRYVSCEQIVDTAGLTVDSPVQRLLHQPDDGRRCRRDPERRALHRSAPRTTSATRSSRRRTPPRPAGPTRTGPPFDAPIPER